MKDTGNTIGGNIPDNTYTRAGAAYMVSRSTDTLKRWHRSGLCVPSQSMQAGQLTVWLYTNDDIRKLREVARRQKPGRKPKG